VDVDEKTICMKLTAAGTVPEFHWIPY